MKRAHECKLCKKASVKLLSLSDKNPPSSKRLYCIGCKRKIMKALEEEREKLTKMVFKN